MAIIPPRAKVWSKRIGLGGLIGILLITAAAFYEFYGKNTEIKSQINIASSFPPLRENDGVYQYHIWLEGSEKTTMFRRVEVNLNKNPARLVYSKTKSVSVIGRGWKPYSSNGIKGGMKGIPGDDVYLKYEMDGRQFAKSWTLVELTVEVEFKFTQFWIDFNPSLNFTFEVPGPYNRTGERHVDRTIKWTSNDDMAPEYEWETIEEN